MLKQMSENLNAIKEKEDLKAKSGVNINPSPTLERCKSCGRHVSELKPYEAEDLLGDDFDVLGAYEADTLVADFEGVKLCKTLWDFTDEEAHRIMGEFFNDCRSLEDEMKALERFVQKYGKEKAGEIIYSGRILQSD